MDVVIKAIGVRARYAHQIHKLNGETKIMALTTGTAPKAGNQPKGYMIGKSDGEVRRDENGKAYWHSFAAEKKPAKKESKKEE